MSKLLAGAAALAFTASLQAHHSVMMFDLTTPIRVKGVIAEVHFANPHAYIFVDDENADGTRVRWAVENSGTLAMTRQRGFDEQTLQAGDAIVVCGYAPTRAPSSAAEMAERGTPRPEPGWGKWNRVVTGRLLILKSGPAEDWSHYGPLEACRTLLASP